MKTGTECHKIINKGMCRISGFSSFLFEGNSIGFNVQAYVIGNMSLRIVRSIINAVRENLHS